MCFRLNPAAFENGKQGISLLQREIYTDLDPSTEFHYIAYNLYKPFNAALSQLISKLSMGVPDMLALVKEWVALGNNINEINAKNQSLLHIACQYSLDSVAKWLLEQGIAKETRDKEGWTPILCAINTNNIPLVYYLIQKGAMTQPVFTTTGSSYFHYLVRIIPSPAELETYGKILEETSKIYQLKSCQANFSLETPLHGAAAAGNMVALSWLLDPVKELNLDPEAETEFGDTALHLGVQSGNLQVVNFLINHFRIDVPARFAPKSPFSLATKLGYTEIANVFPTEAKLRLNHLNSYILQYITDRLDAEGLIKWLTLSRRFRNLAQSTLERKYKGRAPAKINFWASIDFANQQLQEDLKACSTPEFLEGWNKFPDKNTAPQAYSRLFKIIMLGYARVGATTLLQRAFNTSPYLDFDIRTVEVNNEIIKFQFWDRMTEANRYYFRVPTTYFRRARVAIILYDSSENNTETFNDIKRYWLNMLSQNASNCLILFVGTKADIERPNRITTDQMAEYLKKLYDVPFMYTTFGPQNADELHRFPYIVETRIDDVESIQRMFRLAAYMAIRFNESSFTPTPAPPKKTIASYFASLVKKKK